MTAPAAPSPSPGVDWDALFAAARLASRAAYCPYSRFPVGAALQTADGQIHAGCNVENASYGLTSCAERNAVFRMVAATPPGSHPQARTILALVVYTPTARPSAPCGACRQVLSEFAPSAELVCVCDTPHTLRATVASLLPEAFGPLSLNPSDPGP